MHPEDELTDADGLDDVVVRAELEGDDPVDLVGALGEEEEGNVSMLPAPAYPPEDVEAAHVRQVVIGDDHRGTSLDQGPDGLLTCGAIPYVEAGILELLAEAGRTRDLGADEEDERTHDGASPWGLLVTLR